MPILSLIYNYLDWIGLDWIIYLTELQSIHLYYSNYTQPQLQDPWNEPLALRSKARVSTKCMNTLLGLVTLRNMNRVDYITGNQKPQGVIADVLRVGRLRFQDKISFSYNDVKNFTNKKFCFTITHFFNVFMTYFKVKWTKNLTRD